MKYRILFLASFLGLYVFGYSQNATLSGVIKDEFSNEPLLFTNIIVYNTTNGTTSNDEGIFSFENLQPGFVRLQVSSVGYEPLITEEIMISAVRSNFVEVLMRPTTTDLEEVRVVASPFAQRAESPVSLQRIGIEIIEKSAGSGRDFAKVLQSFPGVGSTASFRNDLIVRGGGPSENRFFLDGIEMPVLNHFSTQGASGGPVGILNVDFIREVDFYSGAFPAARGNALSSVFEFKQIEANREKTNFKSTLGASEVSLSVNTPLSDKTGAIFSVRRSYLQFLFNQIGLPFLPTFNDFQFMTKTRIDSRNEITFLGVGALDQFKLNLSAEDTENNRYILSYLPINEQWNYTLGSAYKHFLSSSYYVLSVSRSHLNNTIFKYADNDDSSRDNLLYDYKSEEIENKLRFEYFANPGEYTISTGFNLEYADYFNRTSNNLFVAGTPTLINYQSNLGVFKWGGFGSLSRSFFDRALSLSAGIRVDANNYGPSMSNPIDQFSPRASAAVRLMPMLFFNSSVGRYFQLPAYTTLGYRDQNGVLQNKENNLTYIQADHLIAGLEWRANSYTRITVEGFRKNYSNYPISLIDGVSLASKGADFGVLGDEEVTSDSEGIAYGGEFLVQQRSPKGLSYILAYTWVTSEFTDASGKYIASSWDSGHLLTFTLTKSFKRNWDAGLKWRYIGALPYTPYDLETSERVDAWDVRGREYLDFARFNRNRFNPFHQLDLRVDKSYYFKNFSLGFYLDIQNAYNFQNKQAPKLVQVLDENNNPLLKPDDASRYQLKELVTTSGTVLPSVGIIIEF